MAKPVGSLCNLRCSYCYYLDAGKRNGLSTERMSDETLERFVKQYLEGAAQRDIQFTWHGGEPALAGIDFYKRAVELEVKYLPQGKRCWNNLQTNGTLLDDEFCDFLADAKFDVGLSLDGTAYLHDLHRKDAGGGKTWDKTIAACRRLLRRGVKPDLLCTVTSESAERPLAVYRALRGLHTGWIQFIPIVQRGADGNLLPESVGAKAWGSFLISVFDEWLAHDAGKTEVQLFAECARVMQGGSAGLCTMAETCGSALIVERDGGVYSCDHFVRPEYRLGDVYGSTLAELAALPRQRAFGEAKRASLPAQCVGSADAPGCDWLRLCNGGCPKDRVEGVNLLCEGYKAFFAHAAPRIARLLYLPHRRSMIYQ
jgi:uncharacterized protein